MRSNTPALCLTANWPGYLAGEVTVDEALANIEEGWEEITDDFGRDDQAAIYSLSLGITN